MLIFVLLIINKKKRPIEIIYLTHQIQQLIPNLRILNSQKLVNQSQTLFLRKPQRSSEKTQPMPSLVVSELVIVSGEQNNISSTYRINQVIEIKKSLRNLITRVIDEFDHCVQSMFILQYFFPKFSVFDQLVCACV